MAGDLDMAAPTMNDGQVAGGPPPVPPGQKQRSGVAPKRSAGAGSNLLFWLLIASAVFFALSMLAGCGGLVIILFVAPTRGQVAKHEGPPQKAARHDEPAAPDDNPDILPEN